MASVNAQPMARPASRERAELPAGVGLAERRRLFLLCLALPVFVYVAAVALVPLAHGLWNSFFDYNLLKPNRRAFTGFANYVKLWEDATAMRALFNTLLFTVIAVTLEMVLGLALALMLWADDRFNRICLALLLIPVSVTPLAVGLVFRALLSAEFGFVGYYAREIGLVGERGFWGYPASAFGAIVLIDVWQWTPLMALILLAGLKSLPGELIEAANIDGASPWQKLRLVILPLLVPAVMLGLVLRTMDAFRVFDSVFVTTKGGPEDTTNVLQFYAVKQGLEFFNIGYASAISTMMLACIGLIAGAFVILIRRSERKVARA